jgi:glycosyltransferase involved in cell wall biosynthesis
MTSQPAVSVIIPTYNRADLLPEAINSVLTQTYSDYEVIVVDHGSTDDTLAMLRRNYAGRVRTVALPHCPLPACARNAGVAAATGDYVAFLDSDDIWLPFKLERQMQAAGRHPKVALFYSLAQKFGGAASGGITMQYHYRPSGRVFYPLLFYNFIPTLTTLVRRNVFAKVGHFDMASDLRGAEDYDLWLRIARKHTVRYVPGVLARYRSHPDNLSSDILSGFDRCDKVLRKTFARDNVPRFIQRKALSHIEMGRFEFGLILQNSPDDVRPALERAIYIDPFCLTARMGLLLLRWVGFYRLKRAATVLRNVLAS